MTDPAFLHVRTQTQGHRDVEIVGTRAALRALADARLWAADGVSVREGRLEVREGPFFAADGEGFDVIVHREDEATRRKA